MSQEQSTQQNAVNINTPKYMENVATLTPETFPIAQYCINHARFDPNLVTLREKSAVLPEGKLATEMDTLAAIKMIVSLIGAKSAIDIGTFTGMSALLLAKTVSDDGKVITIDISDKYQTMAQEHWTAAGVNQKIESLIGDGVQVLDEIFQNHGKHSFDVAYVDANKEAYGIYYEKLLSMIRPQGVILLDNVLWKGRVANPEFEDEVTTAVRAINDRLHKDDRIEFNLLMVGDGLGVCHIKPQQ
eukprot:g4181.t1